MYMEKKASQCSCVTLHLPLPLRQQQQEHCFHAHSKTDYEHSVSPYRTRVGILPAALSAP